MKEVFLHSFPISTATRAALEFSPRMLSIRGHRTSNDNRTQELQEPPLRCDEKESKRKIAERTCSQQKRRQRSIFSQRVRIEERRTPRHLPDLDSSQYLNPLPAQIEQLDLDGDFRQVVDVVGCCAGADASAGRRGGPEEGETVDPFGVDGSGRGEEGDEWA
jgi:hypothetical protein